MINQIRFNLPRKLIFLMLFVTAVPLISTTPVNAASIHSVENKLGYGARIGLNGSEIGLAVDAASAVNLDWIAVDFNWSEYWPKPNQELNLSKLDMLMQRAAQLNLKVMISITNPPDWLVTPDGPDPEMIAAVLVHLARLYPDTLKAVELFPGANTIEGWGAPANPSAYMNMLRDCTLALKDANSSILLISAGLKLLPAPFEEGSMQDIDFLEQLYTAGAGPWMPVLGLRIPATDSAPLTAPQEESSPVLRHYEVIRSIMLSNQHSQGLIWITGFSWRSSADPVVKQTSMAGESSSNQQISWLEDAYQLMRSQLYIGVVFLGCLNSPLDDSASNYQYACLIDTHNGQTIIHPALQTVNAIIITDHTGHAPISSAILIKQMAASFNKDLIKAEEP